MGNARRIQKLAGYFARCAAVVGLTCLLSSACVAQAQKAAEAPAAPWLEDIRKNPELMAELGKLMDRVRHEVQFPAARSESRLLPLLPEGTLGFIAYPNYGEMLHKTLSILQQERQENAALRDYLQRAEVAAVWPKVEDSLEKGYQISQYLGEEILVSGTAEERKPKILVLAEIRKPGLKNFLQQIVNGYAVKEKTPVRVLDPQELATAKDATPAEQILVLVRPDFVVWAADLATLRSFNAKLDRHGREFASTAFGRRSAQAYEGGVSAVGALDAHGLLSLIPPGKPESQMIFKRTGFADMEYLVWRQKIETGQSIGQVELSFNGPRHGAAAWLVAPGELVSLDFVSPKAMMAGSALLKSPAEIFEDVKEIAGTSGAQAFASLPQFEQMLNVRLKEDLLDLLGGEITLELDDLTPRKPVWKVFWRVKDPDHLQKTFGMLLGAGKLAAEASEEGGATYHAFHVPSGKTTYAITYAFAGGYLIVGPSQETVGEAIRLHDSGEGLGKTKKFLAALPPGHASGASAIFYEDPIGVVSALMRQAAPELVGSLEQLGTAIPPLVVGAYGGEKAIREESTYAGVNATTLLMVAAIAIPSVIQARTAANEASAVASLRTVNVGQITYSATYPDRGFAPDLATLGSGPDGTKTPSADHAILIDSKLGDASCTAGAWCKKSGFRFTIMAMCTEHHCQDYAVFATPVSGETGRKNFCTTSDGVVRSKTGLPMESPVSVAECREWAPLQ